MKKIKSIVIVACMMLCITTLLCSCGKTYKMEDYVGTYVGQAGTVITLEADGKCQYNITRNASWRIEDDRIIVDTGICEIYAEINDSGLMLLFQSDSSRWNDELFVKVIE